MTIEQLVTKQHVYQTKTASDQTTHACIVSDLGVEQLVTV